MAPSGSDHGRAHRQSDATLEDPPRRGASSRRDQEARDGTTGVSCRPECHRRDEGEHQKPRTARESRELTDVPGGLRLDHIGLVNTLDGKTSARSGRSGSSFNGIHPPTHSSSANRQPPVCKHGYFFRQLAMYESYPYLRKALELGDELAQQLGLPKNTMPSKLWST